MMLAGIDPTARGHASLAAADAMGTFVGGGMGAG